MPATPRCARAGPTGRSSSGGPDGPATVRAVQRDIEHEADRFGLEIAQNNDAAAGAFVKLGTESLGLPEPGWLERTFRMSHPSLADRITFANDYHPWADGQPLVYGDRIKAP